MADKKEIVELLKDLLWVLLRPADRSKLADVLGHTRSVFTKKVVARAVKIIKKLENTNE